MIKQVLNSAYLERAGRHKELAFGVDLTLGKKIPKANERRWIYGKHD
jgi:hypothetical protein